MKLIRRDVVLILFLFFAGMLYSQPAPSKPTMPPPPSREHSEHLEPPPRPPKDESKILNYRGSRTYIENLPLKINQIKCTAQLAQAPVEYFYNHFCLTTLHICR